MSDALTLLRRIDRLERRIDQGDEREETIDKLNELYEMRRGLIAYDAGGYQGQPEVTRVTLGRDGFGT